MCYIYDREQKFYKTIIKSLLKIIYFSNNFHYFGVTRLFKKNDQKKKTIIKIKNKKII